MGDPGAGEVRGSPGRMVTGGGAGNGGHGGARDGKPRGSPGREATGEPGAAPKHTLSECTVRRVTPSLFVGLGRLSQTHLATHWVRVRISWDMATGSPAHGL